VTAPALAPETAEAKPPVSRRSDRVFEAALAFAAFTLIACVGALVLILLQRSAPALREFGPSFLFHSDWDPVRDGYGALPFVVGTIASSVLALLLAVPIGIGSALFISELAPPGARRVLGLLIDMLAAVPSVIYGMWGIFVLAPWVRAVVEPVLGDTLGKLPLIGRLFQGPRIGISLLCASMVLAIVILPYIASVARETLISVPRTYREAALALGATRWEMIRTAVLPAARSGLAAAIFLGLGRALGETMAVTMVIGNVPEVPKSLFHPAHTIASAIANEFAEAAGTLHLAALFELALVLLLVTLVVNAAGRVLLLRLGPAGSGRRAE
jgi:phosphate transport system permease protein